MAEFMILCLELAGSLCFVQGQIFKISAKFMDGNLIFTWSNISATRNDIFITKDSQSSAWIQVYDDQYTVEDVLQYKSVTIKVRELNTYPNYEEYNKTFKVNTQESKIGESRNISWTTDYFPRAGLYFIFHAYNGSTKQIMQIGDSDPSTEKYVYHTRPLNSVNIQFEVMHITLQDAGYYVGGTSEANAWSGRGGTVLVVSGIPVKPIISGNLNIQVRKYAFLKCKSRSTSAPSYYKKFPPLSYSWFVNNTRLDREVRDTYNFIVTKDVKYNRYSCQAKETLESEKSDEIKMNPLYGPETVLVTPEPPNDELNIHDGDTFGPYNCSADCNPPCSVQWKYKDPLGGFRDVTPLGTSSVTVPEQKANRTRMELIRCVVNGSEGKETSSIKLNIQYLSDPKVYINGNLQNSLTVDEGSPLYLACNMEGNPVPFTTLKELTANKILWQSSTTWLNHTIRREAVCSDTSTYRCEGSSLEFERKYQTFNINVLCNPRLDMTTIVKANYRSMSGPDVIVPVTVPVIANPPISQSGIKWSGPSATSILTNVDLQRDTFIYKQLIISSIPIPDQRAFGNYSLVYRGKTIYDIIINAADNPQPPLNFNGYSYTPGYINLTWISNFNGGLDQFFLLYLKEGSNWRDIKNLTDPGEGEVGFFDPGLLNTGQEYWFRLESCNKINCSRPPEIKVRVQGAISDLREATTQTTWVVVGVLIGLTVLLMTNFGVYKFAFYRGIRSGLNQAPQPSMDLKIMNKEYDDVDDVTVEAQDQSPNNQTYEDVTENREVIHPLTDYQNISGHQDNQYEELKPDQERFYSSLKVQ
ncbi:carcinoembryonic antigen-related cell adhesion molecule 5-like isoform X7 [Saccostrea cucullata]|uniref:carcinoembryonic antigen-related cell adhesion molecule 5-like isoform X7 n=1 Tax=Saccostrea cuccullata TaxID=36930 RepID=UPI002ED0CD16